MKCPYCGWESENQHCDHCKAWIPTKNETKEESEKTREQNKESE